MSISLNGNTANYLSNANSLSLAPNSAQTWAGWFKPANTSATKMAWAGVMADGYTTLMGMQFYDAPDIRPFGGGGNGSAIKAYSADTWYYVYWRGSGSAFALRAGAAVSGLSVVGDFSDGDYSIGQSGTATAYTSIQIGKKGADGYPFNGEICCVRVWSSQLTTAQLLAEAKSATPVYTTGLLADWRLANSSDLTSTVNSHVLTFNGTPASGSTEPTDIAGASAVPILASTYYRMLGS